MEEVNNKQSEILELKSYLYSTDYRVTRSFETKTEIDSETLEARAEARRMINQLENEIKELETLELENLDINENNIQ